MARSFATGTKVPVERTQGEISKTLIGAGASAFGTHTDIEKRIATIGFKYQGLHIEMSIRLPDRYEVIFTHDNQGKERSDAKSLECYEAELRRLWRCLALALKAKVVAVSDGVTTFEKEFMPYVVTADGVSIGDKLLPILEQAKKSGKGVSPLLALPGGSD